MSDGRDHGRRDAEPGPDLRRALQQLERPAARPEFRAALRERFLDVGEERPGTATPAARAGAPPPRRLLLLAGTLAAAAAIVLTMLLTKSRAPLWRVHPSSTASTVVVDGIALRGDDAASLVAALETARELEARGGTLRVCVRDEAWIEITDGTRLSQMKFAAAGPYQVRTDTGSLAVATLPAFAGRGMRVVTQDVDVQVTGTTFAVDVDAEGSCVCILEGTVRCQPAGETLRPVAAGEMCFSFRNRAAPVWGPACEPHLEHLRGLRP